MTRQHNTTQARHDQKTPGTDKSKRIDQDQDRENEDKNQIIHHSFLIRRLWFGGTGGRRIHIFGTIQSKVLHIKLRSMSLSLEQTEVER